METRGFSWKQGRARSTNHQIVFLSIKIFAAELRILTCRLISETRLAVALIMTFHLASLFSFPRVCAGKRFARRVNGKHKDKLSSQRIYGEDREGGKKVKPANLQWKLQKAKHLRGNGGPYRASTRWIDVNRSQLNGTPAKLDCLTERNDGRRASFERRWYTCLPRCEGHVDMFFLFLFSFFLFFFYDGISLDRGSNISSDGPRVLTVNRAWLIMSSNLTIYSWDKVSWVKIPFLETLPWLRVRCPSVSTRCPLSLRSSLSFLSPVTCSLSSRGSLRRSYFLVNDGTATLRSERSRCRDVNARPSASKLRYITMRWEQTRFSTI